MIRFSNYSKRRAAQLRERLELRRKRHVASPGSSQLLGEDGKQRQVLFDHREARLELGDAVTATVRVGEQAAIVADGQDHGSDSVPARLWHRAGARELRDRRSDIAGSHVLNFAVPLVILIGLVAILAAPATAADKQVQATVKVEVLKFNTYWNRPDDDNYAANSTAATTEASRLTIAITKLKLTAATTPKVKLGKALALQAFGKMAAGARSWSAYQLDLLGGKDVLDPVASAHADASSVAFEAGQPLLRAALKQLGLKLPVYKFKDVSP